MKYIALLLALITATAFAQDNAWWEWQNPKPQGSNLTDVAMLDSATYFAIGDGGLVIRTTDDGATWDFRAFEPPKTPSEGLRLNAIAFSPDKQRGTIVSYDGYRGYSWCVIFVTTNQGISWEQSQADLGEAILRDVCYVSDLEVFAVGNRGVILYSSDGGFSWERVPNEIISDDFFAISFADRMHGFIAAKNGIFYVTTDGGEQWIRKEFTYGNTLYAIDVAEGNLEYAIAGGDAGGVFLSSDSGTTWKQRYAGTGYAVRSTIRLSKDRAIICGDYYKLSVTTDGGVSWQYPLTDFRSDHLKALSFADAKQGVCVGSNGIILRTTDGGSAWYPAFENAAERELLRGVFCFDTLSAVAVGSVIVRTSDRGKKWERVESPTQRILRGVDFPAPTIGYAAGDSGVVIKSTDAGLTWTKLQTPFVSNLLAVDFLDADNGVVAGQDGMIAVTTDGAVSWLVTKIPDTCGITCAAYLSTTSIILGGCGLLRSTDQGKSWRKFSALRFTCQSISFSDTLYGFAGGYYGGVGEGIIPAAASTSDGGTTWNDHGIGPGKIGIFAVSAADRKRATAVGSRGFSAHTTDGGMTWIPVETNTRGTIYAVHHPTPRTATAVGFRSLILRLTTTDGPLAVPNPLPSANSLVTSIHPNPAISRTTISFTLPAAGVVTFELFTTEGKLVRQLYRGLVAPGEQSLEADLAGLASGSYFLTVSSADGREYHRIVLER